MDTWYSRYFGRQSSIKWAADSIQSLIIENNKYSSIEKPYIVVADVRLYGL